jgi:CheY-like chemotaxis protein
MIRVLVVDDDDVVRVTVRTMLGRAGYEVEEACDGSDGLNLLRGADFDLIITDIIMPDCEGIEFIRRALAQRPDRRILAMSGGGRLHNTEFLDIARKCGARAILPKPFDPAELMTAVGLALQ